MRVADCTLGGEVEVGGYGFRGGFGGVDDGEWVVQGGEGSPDGRFEKWVMGAAEEEGLCVGGFGQGLFEVDFQDFVGDWMVDPAFFYQRDEEGAGFFVGFEVEVG